MFKELKEEVWKANMDLPRYGLITFTWGNVSGIHREKGIIVIKPSGVPYSELKPEHMVVLDLDGNKVEGILSPPPTPQPIWFYTTIFREIGGVVHTHSSWATSFAQAGKGSYPWDHPRRLLMVKFLYQEDDHQGDTGAIRGRNRERNCRDL